MFDGGFAQYMLAKESDVVLIPKGLSPVESERLQGFPDDFKFPVSDAQAYHQLGNSVSVPIIKLIMKEMIRTYNKIK